MQIHNNTKVKDRINGRSKFTSSGCREWQGGCDRFGYGRIMIDGKRKLAHRVVWELENGPIPDGMCILHRCDNPKCNLVSHLFLGTKSDNAKDRNDKGRNGYRVSLGERNGNSRLTKDDVDGIRRDYASGESQVNLSRKYGTSDSNVARIVLNQTWRE